MSKHVYVFYHTINLQKSNEEKLRPLAKSSVYYAVKPIKL